MEHTNVTAVLAEARQSCANQVVTSFKGVGTIEQQPHFRPVSRRNLMATVNVVARDLGLRPPAVMVLDALLSCLSCKDASTGQDTPITPLTLLTVFAANDTLCFRAKGITDRQLRRHLSWLEEVGLIRRRDSANGKRFPIYRSGKLVGAFGIDLSPLLSRSEELLSLANRRRAEAEELRGVKSCVQRLRVECQRLPLDEDVRTFVEATSNIMRRTSTTLSDARAIVKRLETILIGHSSELEHVPHDPATPANTALNADAASQMNCAESSELSGTDGRNVRHKEPPKSYPRKYEHLSAFHLWNKLDTISKLYPDIPRTEHGLRRVVFEVGQMLRIGKETLAKAVSAVGCSETLFLQDRIAAKIDQISNADGYLATMISEASRRKVGHGQLQT